MYEVGYRESIPHLGVADCFQAAEARGTIRGPKILRRARDVFSQGTGLRVLGWVTGEGREAEASPGR